MKAALSATVDVKGVPSQALTQTDLGQWEKDTASTRGHRGNGWSKERFGKNQAVHQPQSRRPEFGDDAVRDTIAETTLDEALGQPEGNGNEPSALKTRHCPLAPFQLAAACCTDVPQSSCSSRKLQCSNICAVGLQTVHCRRCGDAQRGSMDPMTSHMRTSMDGLGQECMMA